MTNEEYKEQYAKQYMGSFLAKGNLSQDEMKDYWSQKFVSNGFVPNVKNQSDESEWKHAFMSSYAPDYLKWESARKKLQSKFPDVPQQAGDCKNMSQLEDILSSKHSKLHKSGKGAFQK
eukprot:2675290-Amphidinium_carterae.1